MGTVAAPEEVVPLEDTEYLEPPCGGADAWTLGAAKVSGILLLAGFLWPLVKTSLLFGEEAVIIWPWSLWGGGEAGPLWAAMAPAEPSGKWVSWSILPLAGGLAALALRRWTALPRRAAGMFVTGLALLVLLLWAYAEEALIYGVLFLGPQPGLQVFLTGLAAGGALIAVANHLRRSFTVHGLPRLLSGIGGALTLGLLFAPLANGTPVAALLIDGDAWRTAWALELTLIALAAHAVLGLVSACRIAPGERLLFHLGSAPRLILGWLPLAYLLMREALGGGYATYVLEGGGGACAGLMAVVKCSATYYGAAILMAAGLAGWLSVRLERGYAAAPPPRG
jgi:hypothetical protein